MWPVKNVYYTYACAYQFNFFQPQFVHLFICKFVSGNEESMPGAARDQQLTTAYKK